MNLHSTEYNPCPTDIIGVALSPDRQSPHCGLVYTTTDGGVRLCELRRHHDLNVREVPPDYFWTPVKLRPAEVFQIAAFVDLVIAHHASRPLPYSFVYTQDAFDVTGTIRDGAGLTCATFVLAIFDRLKIYIVNAKTWKERKREDQAFRDSIINYYIRIRNDADVAMHLVAEVPKCRIKPGEVCGAAADDKYPVNFSKAVALEAEVYKLIARYCRPVDQIT